MINGAVSIGELEDGVMVKCQDIFGKEASMFLPTNADTLKKYLTGEYHVQALFPHFNADQREFLITGLTPEGFDQIMPDEE